LPGFSLDGYVEGFFAVKVVAKSGDVDTGEVADFPDMSAVESSLGKDLAGDLEDPLPGRGGVVSRGASWALG
jgi:hypothetical protein